MEEVADKGKERKRKRKRKRVTLNPSNSMTGMIGAEGAKSIGMRVSTDHAMVTGVLMATVAGGPTAITMDTVAATTAMRADLAEMKDVEMGDTD